MICGGTSDMTKIATITPIMWDEHLLLSFDIKWIELFGKTPEFKVILEKNRLILLGPKLKEKNNV